jgi:hypothetical protein
MIHEEYSDKIYELQEQMNELLNEKNEFFEKWGKKT